MKITLEVLSKNSFVSEKNQKTYYSVTAMGTGANESIDPVSIPFVKADDWNNLEKRDLIDVTYTIVPVGQYNTIGVKVTAIEKNNTDEQ